MRELPLEFDWRTKSTYFLLPVSAPSASLFRPACDSARPSAHRRDKWPQSPGRKGRGGKVRFEPLFPSCSFSVRGAVLGSWGNFGFVLRTHLIGEFHIQRKTPNI